MLLKNKGLMLLKVKKFRFGNNILNGSMLNTKQIENNQKWLTILSNFFNLLTRWLGGKLENLSSLLIVYQIYPESTKKRIYISQLTEDKWTRKLVRIKN